MILFDDVDIMIIVEKTIDGEAFPLPYMLRQANQKSVQQIHNEIRAVQAQAAGHGDMMLGQGQTPWFATLYPWMPKMLRQGMGPVADAGPLPAQEDDRNGVDHRAGHDGALWGLGDPHRHATALLCGGRDCAEAGRP
jgi:hypothetical protein